MSTTPDLEHADLITGGMACAVMASEMRKEGRTEVARGLDLARLACEQLLKRDAAAPTPETAPAPTMAPLSGTGGPTAGYVMNVMPAPHARSVGRCDGCGGELTHRPDCPKIAPSATPTEPPPPSSPKLRAERGENPRQRR